MDYLNKFFILKIIFWCQCSFANTHVTNNDTLSNLKESINTFSGIDLNDIDWKNFSFLEKAVGDSRVVVVSVPTHHSGTAILLENECIKYLHAKMGFDVLILEDVSLYYAYTGMKEIQADSNFILSTIRYFHGALPNLNELPLYDYFEKCRKSHYPLSLAGMNIDSEVITKKYMPMLDDIKIMLKKYGIDKIQKISEKLPTLYNIIDNGECNSATELKELETLVNDILKNLNLIIPSTDLESKIFSQALKNLFCQIKTYTLNTYPKHIDEVRDFYMFREKQMADNVFFLHDNLFKHHKIIISTTNFHSMRNFIDYKNNQSGWNLSTPTGQYLYNHYGEKMYTIAFVDYDGINGYFSKFEKRDTSSQEETDDDSWRFRKKADPVPIRKLVKYTPKPKNSLESNLNELGLNFAFLNLKNNPKLKHNFFLMQPIRGENPCKKDWSKSYDGIFFYKNETPIKVEYGFNYLYHPERIKNEYYFKNYEW